MSKAQADRLRKSEAAFRTISEVATELSVPQHVLRFWESKFSPVSPLKRGGGRRYYRPEDITLLKRIRSLLYDDGLTIKGVQKLFRDHGIKAIVDGEGGPVNARKAKVQGETELNRLDMTTLLNDLKGLRDTLRTALATRERVARRS
ncbi:MAG: MerR family transcriptional regulator [Rhodospirillaceae bacterium]|nr:MerR family transcriptional regulator [Rhodospirillaceae bacterium]